MNKICTVIWNSTFLVWGTVSELVKSKTKTKPVKIISLVSIPLTMTITSSSKTDVLGNSTATNLGGGSKYENSPSAISTLRYVTTKTDGTTTIEKNVGDAFSNLNREVIKPVIFTDNSDTVDRKFGKTLNIIGGLTGAGSNSNIKTVIKGKLLDIHLANAPVFSATVTSNDLDANGNKLESLADATAASDTVNNSQLDSLISTALNRASFDLKAVDGNTVNKKLGKAVEVVGADSNMNKKVASCQVMIELNKNLSNFTGITVNDATYGKDKEDRKVFFFLFEFIRDKNESIKQKNYVQCLQWSCDVIESCN